MVGLRILVIGAGLVGSVIVKDLARFYRDVDKIIVGDIDLDKALALEKYDNRIEGIRLDVRDIDAVKRILDKVDCVVNATYYGLAKYVLDAALETKTPYLDLGSSQYGYDEKFKEVGVPAMIDVGGAPGLINMLAKYLVEDLDVVDYIHLYDVNKEVNPPYRENPIRWKYSVETVLDEATMDAVVYREGEFVKVPPFSGMEERFFPEPIGVSKVFMIFHPEVITLAETYRDKGVKEVWYKIDAFNLPWEEGMRWKLIADLGLAGKEPIEVNGVKVSPRSVLLDLLKRLDLSFDGWSGYEMLQAVVAGVKNGEYNVKSATAIAKVSWDTGSLLTAVPASIVAYWLAKGVINEAGAHPVERVLDAGMFFNELSKRRIQIIVRDEKD